MHSQVMANLSPALDALINGKMREAITQRVNWSDVDEIVFFQLCEFAYSKDYTVPSPDRITVSTPNTAATGDPNDDSEKSEAQKQTIHSHNDTPSAEHQESFNTVLAGSEDLTGSEDSYSSTFEIDGNWENAMTLTQKFLGDRYFTGKGTFNLEELNQWSQFNPYPQMEWFPEMASKGYNPDLTSVLIEQAKLYALSDLWGIEELRKLVVFKIYEIMKFFTDDRVALKGTLEFVSFVYDNTHPTMESPTMESSNTDSMRKLAATYLFAVLPSLDKSAALFELMGNGGDLTVDLLHVMLGHRW